MDLSIAEENYIKAIYALAQKGKVNTNTLAQTMHTKASSATDMLQRLGEKGLVDYIKYYGVSLSEEGNRTALKTIRKHRLWEVFLVDKLGFGWDEVHDIAEQLEHVHSAKLTEKLAVFLGNPMFDPHGDPIPNQLGELPKYAVKTLQECAASEKVIVARVKDGNPEFLQYLQRIALKLGEKLTVKTIFSFDNSVEVEREDGSTLMLSETVSEHLFVTKP